MFAVNWVAVASLPIGIFSSYLKTEVSWVACSPPDPVWQPSTMRCTMSVDIFLTVKEKSRDSHRALELTIWRMSFMKTILLKCEKKFLSYFDVKEMTESS